MKPDSKSATSLGTPAPSAEAADAGQGMLKGPQVGIHLYEGEARRSGGDVIP